MVKLTRKSDGPNIVAGRRTFFTGCKTYMNRLFFQAKNEAELFNRRAQGQTLSSVRRVARLAHYVPEARNAR